MWKRNWHFYSSAGRLDCARVMAVTDLRVAAFMLVLTIGNRSAGGDQLVHVTVKINNQIHEVSKVLGDECSVPDANGILSIVRSHLKNGSWPSCDDCRNEADKEKEPTEFVPDFIYNNTRFVSVVRKSINVTFEEARRICSRRGGKPAYFLDATHYNLTLRELRKKTPNRLGNFNVWTGIYYNATTNATTIDGGFSAPFVKWSSWSPEASDETNVILLVDQRDNSTGQGLYVMQPSYKTHGVICQE